MQFFSTDANTFSKFFFVNKNFTKWDSKVAHNRPRPFYLTVQPRPQPTAQNWFFQKNEISGPDICYFICGKYLDHNCKTILTHSWGRGRQGYCRGVGGLGHGSALFCGAHRDWRGGIHVKIPVLARSRRRPSGISRGTIEADVLEHKQYIFLS